jgi:predicted transcriptional regulator
VQHLKRKGKTAMSKLIRRQGGYRYVYDEDGHVEQVDEISAKMTNISLQSWPDFESAERALQKSQVEWRQNE